RQAVCADGGGRPRWLQKRAHYPGRCRAALFAYSPDYSLVRVGHVHVAICIERQPVEAGVLARNGHEHRGSARVRIDGEDLWVLVIDSAQPARVRLEPQAKPPTTGALRVDGPQELAVRVEHKETSWARVRLVRSYG